MHPVQFFSQHDRIGTSYRRRRQISVHTGISFETHGCLDAHGEVVDRRCILGQRANRYVSYLERIARR